MNNSINSGLRPRPSSNLTWFDKLLEKLHVKSSSNKSYIKNVLLVEELLADISKKCRNLGLNYSITVDWTNELVSFERVDEVNNTSLRHEISFDELLSDKFNPQTFVSFRLHENNN